MASVIITGAGGGVGLAATEKLAKAGYIVYAGVIDEWEMGRVHSLKNRLNSTSIFPVMLDLRKKEDIENVVSMVEQNHPDFAGLVTNGATAPIGIPFEHWTDDFVEEVYSINVFGNIRLIRRCLGLLKRNQGRIVHVSSIFGKAAGALCGVYSSSKHAGEALFTTIRRELERFGIKVVMINPGVICRTYMIAHQHEGAKRVVAEMDGRNPEDITKMVLDEGKNTQVKQGNLVADKTYRPDYMGVIKALQPGMGPKNTLASTPEEVAENILKGMQLEKPKIRYINGWDSWLLITMTRLLPERFMDKVAKKLVMCEQDTI